MRTNLPPQQIDDSAAGTKLFFDSYGQFPLEFSATDVSSTIGFFEGKGFDKDAATITAATLLKQAKIDGLPVFQILDTLRGFTSLELSALVGEILNNNRPSTSTLGFKISTLENNNQKRNIIL